MDLPAWERLVRQARAAGLLGRLAAAAQREGALDAVPAAPRQHLLAALALSSAQQREVLREIGHVAEALAPLRLPVVLLKGAAYVAAGLPAATGRVFSDVDILVPRERLAEVEAALMAHGWAMTHPDAYDQRYYRRWMHELPPMQHTRRQTTLDVHHAILPLTARRKPDAARLLAAARPVTPGPLHVLDLPDLVLHGMAHLFHNELTDRALRDLSDLDLLLRAHPPAAPIWTALPERARKLDLSESLYWGLHFAHAVLGTPVPAQALAAARLGAPPDPRRAVVGALWAQALRAPHDLAAGSWTAMARTALYARAHWLRMPPALLLRHAGAKAWAFVSRRA